MDIADFLQFQRSLQCHGVVVATAQIKEITGVGEYLRELMDFIVAVGKQLFLFVGNIVELSYQLLILMVFDGAACLAMASDSMVSTVT